MKNLWFVFLLVVVAGQLVAQERIQVVTKTINRSFSVGADESLTVQGEKAEVQVKEWNQPEIKLVLQLIAKHPSRQVAENDLSTIRYRVDTETREKIVRNFFRITERAGEINSNLQARYELWVPSGCPLTIRNRYGNVYLSGLDTDIDLTLDFGEVHLDEVEGSLSLQVNYGDVIANDVAGKVSGVVKKTNLTLNNTAGSLYLESSYGKLYVSTQNRLMRMTIDASRTEVTFAAPHLARYYYQLTTSCSEINTTLSGTRQDGGMLGCKKSFTSSQTKLPPIIINTSFSPIHLNTLTHESAPNNTANLRP